MIAYTKLIYLQEMDKFNDTAHVLQLQTLEDGRIALILDQTIFYPQGGGQPFDQGVILNKAGTIFSVQEVRFKDGIVFHIGNFEHGMFEKNESVLLNIDEKRRIFNSRNHSAAHVIDVAIRNLKFKLVPGKGYHFPEGAYVEYSPTLDDVTREELKNKLEKETNRLINEALPVSVQLVNFDELKQMAAFVPDYIPKDKPTRAMIIDKYPAIPCGGTHVSNIKNVGYITIKKIKNEKGNLRISYSIINNHA